MLSRQSTHIPALTAQPGNGLSLIVIDDEQLIRGPVSLCLETLGHRVAEAGSAEEAVAAASGTHFDIALLDIRLGTSNGLDVMSQLMSLQPQLKVIIITAYASIDLAVRSMARGATDFLCKPFTPDQLAKAIAHVAELSELESMIGLSPDRLGTAAAEADFATTSALQQQAVLTARHLAPTSTPILLEGEAGTGKRVFARAIHGWSVKPEGAFLGLDCAAHSAAYVDLALFGDSLFGTQVITAEKPALVHRAAGGTLLLAHVDALSPTSQERLGTLITKGQFPSLQAGAVRPREFRIAATTRESARLVPALASAFSTGTIPLPSLRERSEDIPLIAQRYIGYLRQRHGKNVLGFSGEALDALSVYCWPGNLAELRRVVGDLLHNAGGSTIEKSQLPAAIRDYKKTPGLRPRAGELISLTDLEAAHIRAIVAASPSLRAAAEVLGLDFQALYRRRKQYGLE